MILNDKASFDLACRVRREGAPLDEVFSFVSGLYFRGKAAYAERFAAPPDGVPGGFVITPDRGLIPARTLVTLADLQDIAEVPVDAAESRYRLPLQRAAQDLDMAAGFDCTFVLLVSVATAKYVEPLLKIFGPRLL